MMPVIHDAGGPKKIVPEKNEHNSLCLTTNLVVQIQANNQPEIAKFQPTASTIY